MIGLRVEIGGIKDVTDRLNRLANELQGPAIRMAINKVAEKARTEVKRAITADYAVKAGEVSSAIDLRRTSNTRLEATVTIFGSKSRRGRSANLIMFLAAYQAMGQAIKTRGSKAKKRDLAGLQRQLGFMIKRSGGLKKIEGAFIGNKGRTVFRRTGKGRLPIEPLQVIGFSQMFNSNRIKERVLKKINDELPIEVDRAIKKLLSSK
jgi:hypothetical protein